MPTTIQEARNLLVGDAIPNDGDPDAQRVFVIMYDPSQLVCPVFARDADQAREIVAGKIGVDMSDQPVYDASNDEDVQAIIDIIARRIGVQH